MAGPDRTLLTFLVKWDLLAYSDELRSISGKIGRFWKSFSKLYWAERHEHSDCAGDVLGANHLHYLVEINSIGVFGVHVQIFADYGMFN